MTTTSTISIRTLDLRLNRDPVSPSPIEDRVHQQLTELYARIIQSTVFSSANLQELKELFEKELSPLLLSRSGESALKEAADHLAEIWLQCVFPLIPQENDLDTDSPAAKEREEYDTRIQEILRLCLPPHTDVEEYLAEYSELSAQADAFFSTVAKIQSIYDQLMKDVYALANQKKEEARKNFESIKLRLAELVAKQKEQKKMIEDEVDLLTKKMEATISFLSTIIADTNTQGQRLQEQECRFKQLTIEIEGIFHALTQGNI